jgi:hypothetical protein
LLSPFLISGGREFLRGVISSDSSPLASESHTMLSDDLAVLLEALLEALLPDLREDDVILCLSFERFEEAWSDEVGGCGLGGKADDSGGGDDFLVGVGDLLGEVLPLDRGDLGGGDLEGGGGDCLGDFWPVSKDGLGLVVVGGASGRIVYGSFHFMETSMNPPGSPDGCRIRSEARYVGSSADP